MALLRILGFGACQVHNPVFDLHTRGLAKAVAYDVGFRETLYSHYVEETEQLISFYRGAKSIPIEVRRFLYTDFEYDPTARNGAAVDSSDVVLLEVVSPYRIAFRDYWLNRNEIWRHLVWPHQKTPAEECSARWYTVGLMNSNEDLRLKWGEQLLGHMTGDTERLEWERAVVREARCEKASIEDVAAGIERIRETLGKPIVILTHTNRYMPDGRPIGWPAGFQEQLETLSADLGLPFVRPSDFVLPFGAEAALEANLTYIKPAFTTFLGDRFLELAKSAVAGQGVSAARSKAAAVHA